MQIIKKLKTKKLCKSKRQSTHLKHLLIKSRNKQHKNAIKKIPIETVLKTLKAQGNCAIEIFFNGTINEVIFEAISSNEFIDFCH